MIEKAYGFVLREGGDGQELLVFDHAGMPEAGVQVPGGTIEAAEAPLAAVAREVLEESGLPLEGWEAVATFDHGDVPGSDTPGAQRWHCFVTLPGMPLSDTWRYQPQGSAVERSLRFEHRWIALSGDEALAGKQEEARRAVAAWAAARRR